VSTDWSIGAPQGYEPDPGGGEAIDCEREEWRRQASDHDRPVRVSHGMNGRRAALVALSALGCSDPSSPGKQDTAVVPVITQPPRDVAALFQTDSLSYTLRDIGYGYEVTIGIRFTNSTGDIAYILHCKGATMLNLQKFDGIEWRAAWSPIVPSCFSPPITVATGATYDSQLWVFGANPNTNIAPKFFLPDIPGIYRIVWRDALSSYKNDVEFGTPLPFEQRISNRFALTVEKRK